MKLEVKIVKRQLLIVVLWQQESDDENEEIDEKNAPVSEEAWIRIPPLPPNVTCSPNEVFPNVRQNTEIKKLQ